MPQIAYQCHGLTPCYEQQYSHQYSFSLPSLNFDHYIGRLGCGFALPSHPADNAG